MEIGNLVTQFVALAGIAALISVVVNLLKVAGVVKDGQSEYYVVGLNLLGLVVLFVFHVFQPSAINLPGWDATAASIAQILTIVLGFIGQLGVSRVSYAATKGMPIIGKSFAVAKKK
jgi:hypothetical protein